MFALYTLSGLTHPPTGASVATALQIPISTALKHFINEAQLPIGWLSTSRRRSLQLMLVADSLECEIRRKWYSPLLLPNGAAEQ